MPCCPPLPWRWQTRTAHSAFTCAARTLRTRYAPPKYHITPPPFPPVRKFLFSLQREIADKRDVIMDGRDIGTVILPDADLKVFLTASAEARARRRYIELTEKGIETSVELLIAQQKERDERDSSRDVAPLVPADDAVLLDNSQIGLQETIDEVIRFAREKKLITE